MTPLEAWAMGHNEIGRSKCASKKQYDAEFSKHVVFMAWMNRKITLRRYLCQYCNHWHVTNLTAKEYARRLEQYRKLNALSKKTTDH